MYIRREDFLIILFFLLNTLGNLVGLQHSFTMLAVYKIKQNSAN